MNEQRPRKIILLILAFLLIAAEMSYLQFAGMHEPIVDEAVFGRASLEIIGGDYALTDWRVMKPPIVYFSQAISRAVFGVTPFGGRIPAVLATLGCLVFLFRIGRRWFDEWTGLLAVAFMVVAPSVLFHFPNGRTDATTLFFVLWAIDLAGKKSFGWAGFAFSLAFCTRQLVAISFPLVMAFAFLSFYTSKDALAANWRPYAHITWRFFKGTLPALVVLFIWSFFEKIPFAWLVNELQNKKYTIGEHRNLEFFEKLRYWLRGVSEFFGYDLLFAHAMVAVAAGCLVGLTRLGGKWKFRDHPKRAVIAIVSLFVVFFLLLHSAKFFNTKYRFLVPIVPWVMLLTSWFSLEMLRLLTRFNRQVGWTVGAVFGVVFVGATAWAQVSYLKSLETPWPSDDIPVVVQYIDRTAPSGSILFTRRYGPECDYATWRTGVKQKQLNEKLAKIDQVAAQYPGRELFLYLNPKGDNAWRGKLREILDPIFELVPITDAGDLVGHFYRIKVNSQGGPIGDRIAYWLDGEMVHEPMNCDVLGRLIRDALVPASEFQQVSDISWNHCDPAGDPGRLAFGIQDVRMGKLDVARAQVDYEKPLIDWPSLTMPKRFVIKNAQSANGTFTIDSASLAKFIRNNNKNLKDLEVEITIDGMRLRAVTDVAGRQFTVEAAGRLELMEDKVVFRLESAKIGSFEAPKFLLGYAEKMMNPSFKVDLKAWALQPVSISTKPAPESVIVLRAKQRN